MAADKENAADSANKEGDKKKSDPLQKAVDKEKEMTEEDIAAAIEAEKRKLQLAQQAELDRLAHESAIREQQEAIRMQAEAEARAIA